MEYTKRLTGVLRTWSETRGFGFIQVEENKNFSRFFLHVSKIRSGTLTPKPGDVVEFEVSDIAVQPGQNSPALEVDVFETDTTMSAGASSESENVGGAA